MYTKVDGTIVIHGLDFDAMITPRNTEDDDEYLSIHIFRNDREPDDIGGEYKYEFSADVLARKLGVPRLLNSEGVPLEPDHRPDHNTDTHIYCGYCGQMVAPTMWNIHRPGCRVKHEIA